MESQNKPQSGSQQVNKDKDRARDKQPAKEKERRKNLEKNNPDLGRRR